MKKYFYFVVLSIVFFSCNKQIADAPRPWLPSASYTEAIRAYLKTNLSDSDYAKVDLHSLLLSKEPTGWYLRIALLHKRMDRDFLLLQTDSLGNCITGKFVHISRDSSTLKSFTGTIRTESIFHMAAKQTIITNGVTEFMLDADPDDEDDSKAPDPCSDCLPLVVVVGYAPPGGGGDVSYDDYLSLSGLAGTTNPVSTVPGNPVSGVYSLLTGQPVTATGSSPGTASPKPIPQVTINYETSVSKPGIDVNAFMKCFSAVPDAGSSCSVTIYSDLPVNDNPSYIFNILTGATGHCFLQLSKINGSQSVTQVIGFTTSKPIAMLGFPVPGKIVDNGMHKYNASLTLDLTPAQLTTEINAVVAMGSTPQYDLWENNCVDYALGILNAVRPSNPLHVGMSIDPSTDDPYQTPQSLYIALTNLKEQNGPDAANITLDVIKNAGGSHGACN